MVFENKLTERVSLSANLLEERIFTAFEANRQLHQFSRIPFEFKNAVPCFQRVIDAITTEHDYKDTFAYLDDITVCGKTRKEHDKNLKRFLEAANKCGFMFNDKKCKYAQTSINLLRYSIGNGIPKPDPDRVKPVLELFSPKNV